MIPENIPYLYCLIGLVSAAIVGGLIYLLVKWLVKKELDIGGSDGTEDC